MKQSLKHMLEISGGVSACFLLGALVSKLSVYVYGNGYGYMLLQDFWDLPLTVLILSGLGIFFVDYGKK